MPVSLQAKLLRVLQEKEIVRVGSNTPVKIDCRIIVATHRNLQNEIKKEIFAKIFIIDYLDFRLNYLLCVNAEKIF